MVIMPRGIMKTAAVEDEVVIPRRSLRSIKRKPVEVIDISDEEDAQEENIKQPQKVKKQKLSSLRSHIKSFSSATTPQTTRSPTPESTRSTDTTNTNDQWIDKYAPRSVSEVSIHTKKLDEVKKDLTEMISGVSPYRILVLSGPAGSSKSTIASCLSKELIPNIRHTQPSDTDVIEFTNEDSNDPTVTQFNEFLNTVKYRTGKNLSVILIEDLPNVFHGPTKDSFQKAIEEWLYTDMILPPLVLCITECEFPNDGPMAQGYNIENNYTVETILTRKILNNPKLKRIKFNPTNATLIKKFLKNIYVHENEILGVIKKDEVIQKINELSDFGDIRSAIAAFQFWANFRSRHEDTEKMLSLGKEPSISLFHAIGKCIYGTKTEGENDSTTMDKVMKDFTSKPNILKLGILENYVKFNKSNFDIATASKIADNLSIADLFGLEDASVEFAARSTRTTFRKVNAELPKSANNHASATFPREWKALKKINSIKYDVSRYIETEFKKRRAHRTFQDSNLIYGFFEPLINKERNFKNKAKLHYLKYSNKPIPKELLVSSNTFITERLGGPFREIFGDGDIVPDEEIVKDKYFTTKFEEEDDDSEDGSSDLEFDEDPIVDTDDYEGDATAEDEDGFGDDDTFEKELVSLSQKPSQLKPSLSNLSNSNYKSKNAEFFDDFDQDNFDDSDF